MNQCKICLKIIEESTSRWKMEQLPWIQTQRLTKLNNELRLKNISLERKFRIMTIKLSLLQKGLYGIIKRSENGGI